MRMSEVGVSVAISRPEIFKKNKSKIMKKDSIYDALWKYFLSGYNFDFPLNSDRKALLAFLLDQFRQYFLS